MAAEVLGDMANGSHPTDASSAIDSSQSASAKPFISRMSSLPLVNSALKAYENGKQNSKVMKYGAEMVESGVKSLSKPVFEKFEPTLGQLDDFACRQLERIEKVYPKPDVAQAFPSPADSGRSSNDIVFSSGDSGYFAHRSRGDSMSSTASSSTGSRPSMDVFRPHATRHDEASLRQRSDSQSSQRDRHHISPAHPAPSSFTKQQQQQQQPQHLASGASPASTQQFSGWKGVMTTVGTASAAGVAVFSEESMRSLKYCLQWLQYAVHHIEHQIGLLRSFLESLASPSQNKAIVPTTAASTLASIKKEVVETLRKVINVVSRYAGACLPDHAKINVRQFILSMPVRWASLNNESVPSTPIGSPSLGPTTPERMARDLAALNDTSERAAKVLILANESSDMLQSVSSIFKDTVDKAESWMDKLRYVGVNPQSNTEGLPSWAPTGFPSTPGGSAMMPGGFPGSGLEQYSLRRSSNSSSGAHHSPSHSASGSPSRSLKSSPRLGNREHFYSQSSSHYNRHAYRQKSAGSGDDDTNSDEEEDTHDPMAAMDDSDDEDLFEQAAAGAPNGHGPMKRSMTATNLQGNTVHRRKKRGKSAEVVAGLGLAVEGQAIEQEAM
ncbi:hypothetical protein BGW38_005238 [Lunasporangiospora selenospora]|uniref:Opi1-domain-containing protein n=1 Tax=Lunasporangiospora selenospora TaxID=979761 RepID=A0A9P6FQ76_9FUNG|nr:hypothetical protein BGW38_005238 [Lunasporangiospora selenospora]